VINADDTREFEILVFEDIGVNDPSDQDPKDYLGVDFRDIDEPFDIAYVKWFGGRIKPPC